MKKFNDIMSHYGQWHFFISLHATLKVTLMSKNIGVSS